MRADDPPAGRLLSNGRYTVLLTAAGAGVSTCDGYARTAWSGDRTEDGDGFFVYLRDHDCGTVWSAGARPSASGVRAARRTPGAAIVASIG